jgi:hypothetical protein
MRNLSYALVLYLILSPVARADDTQSLKEYGDALKTFAAGKATIGDYFAAAPKQVLDGIEGRWGLLSRLGEAQPTPESLTESCKTAAWTISKDAFGFSMIHENAGKGYSVAYVNSAGNGFVFTSNLADKLNLMGLGVMDKLPDTLVSARIIAIRSGSGLAMVYRPSANALVIQSFDYPPDIYIRCP